VNIVPGDPGGIRCAAGVLGDTAEDAGAIIDRLTCLGEASGESVWQGPASVAFREKLDELPGRLVKLRDSYTIASGALYTFANDVDQLQDEAVSAERMENEAEFEVDHYEDQKRRAERDFECADLSAYDIAIAQAQQRVGQAKQEVAEVARSYRCAEDRCIATLGDASDAGMENTFFGSVREFLGAVDDLADLIGKVLLVVALVVAVAALLFFTGGTAAALLWGAGIAFKVALVAGAVQGGATIGRWLLGDDVSPGDLAFAALAFVPFLGTGGKVTKLLGKIAGPTELMIGAAAKQLSRFPVVMRAGTKLVSKLPPGWVAKGATVVKNTLVKESFYATVDEFLTVPVLTDVINGVPGVLDRIFRGPTDVPTGSGTSVSCEVDTPPTFPPPPDVPPPTDLEQTPTPEPPSGPSPPAPNPPGSDVSSQTETGPGQGAPGPSGGGSGPTEPRSSGSAPSSPAPQESAPPPSAGGSAAESAPTVVPEPVGANPGEVGDPGFGAEPLVPGPEDGGGQPEPAPAGSDGPVATDGGSPVQVDRGGNPEVTITLEDGTVITVDTPGGAGAPGGEASRMGREVAPVSADDLIPDSPAGTASPVQPVEPVELISASGPAVRGEDISSDSPIDTGAGPGGQQGGGDRPSFDPLDEPRGLADQDSFAEAGSSARPGGGGSAAPGPQASFTPLPPGPTPAAEAPDAPGPEAGGGGPKATATVPDSAAAQLASAKPKIPLGSPLLIGGLAAGGLVGAGAAYVITDAKHKFRKEEEDEPLPPPLGLRF